MIFALVSCVSEDLPQTYIPQEGDKVTLTFDVQVPDAKSATRAGMDDPAITSLQLLVFDREGYFVEKAAATLIDANAGTSDSATPKNPAARQKFSVTLTKTSAYRTIHFVANCAAAASVTFGHEDGLISNLVVGGNQDAYWQRMEFAGGVASGEDAQFNANTLIPLVRNFARVSVTSTADNFELTGFAVVNTRTEGSVAAYAQNKGEFVEFTNGTVAKTYQQIVDDYGYIGFDAGAKDETISFVDITATNNTAAAPAYKYVRETTTNNNPCIIVRGKFRDESEETFYKLNFMLTLDGVKRSVPILRNFSYNFKITDVTKSGHDSAEEALAGSSENDLSGEDTTSSLLNISDGLSQLFVNATSVTLVDKSAYILMYKYIEDITNDNPTTANSEVTVTLDNSDVQTPIFTTVGTGGSVQSLYNAAVTAGDNELAAYYKEYLDYSYVTLTPTGDAPSVPIYHNVFVSANGLSRKVEFAYRQKIAGMTVVAYDGYSASTTDQTVAAATNQKVNVNITIPQGLTQSIFPLEFDIEAAALSIYPDAKMNNLPVRTGQSVILNSQGQRSTATTFGFVKTYTWAEYVAAHGETEPVTITTYFRTNKATSATSVYVDNKYFVQKSSAFTNGGTAINEVKHDITVTFDDEASYYGAGHEVTATINVPNAANTEVNVNVTIGDGFTPLGTSTSPMKTDGNGNITLTLTTAGWSGNRSVTVSYDAEIVSGNQVITYNDGSNTARVNVLYIPEGSLKTNEEDISTRDVYLRQTTNGNNLTEVEFSSSGTNSNNETATINNLAEGTKLYLRYQVQSGGSFIRPTYTTYIAETTAGEAASTGADDITFNQQ